MQGDGLKDGAELVITVGALAEDVQAQIDFRECWDADFAHADYSTCPARFYWCLASCGTDFCATRCLVWPTFLSSSAILSVSMSAGSERRHSESDFSHSAAASSVRPSLEYTSPRCEWMVGSWLSRSTALRSVASASANLFCL